MQWIPFPQMHRSQSAQLATYPTELAEQGTRIFVLLVANDEPPRTEEQRLGPPLMRDLVEQTGGHLVLIPWSSIGPIHRADLLKAAPLIQSDIGTSYRMELSLPEPIKKLASLQVRYSGPDKRLAKDSSWIYPRHISPCSALLHP